jgi:hypothetical protein
MFRKLLFKKIVKPPLFGIYKFPNFIDQFNILKFNIMTNNLKGQLFSQVGKTISAFWSSLFVSSSTREFNRLKNFIAS